MSLPDGVTCSDLGRDWTGLSVLLNLSFTTKLFLAPWCMLELHGIKGEDDGKGRGNESVGSKWTGWIDQPQQLASSCYLLSKGNSGMHKEKQVRELVKCDCDIYVTSPDWNIENWEVTFQANFSLISSVPGIAEPHGVNDCNPFPLLLHDLSVSRTKVYVQRVCKYPVCFLRDIPTFNLSNREYMFSLWKLELRKIFKDHCISKLDQYHFSVILLSSPRISQLDAIFRDLSLKERMSDCALSICSPWLHHSNSVLVDVIYLALVCLLGASQVAQ